MKKITFYLILLVTLLVCLNWYVGRKGSVEKPKTSLLQGAKNPDARDPFLIERACREHISESTHRALAEVDKQVQIFKQWILLQKKGALPFAKEMTSFYAKWRVVKPWFPLTDGEGDKKYVAEQFGKYLFTKQQLSAAMMRSIKHLIAEIDGIENELAVALSQEILGKSLAPDDFPLARQSFEKAMASLQSAGRWDTTKLVSNLIVSEIVATVGVQVGVRLATSAGIVGVGAANSGWTLGGSVLIGLAVDWIWTAIDKPEKDIEQKVSQSLDSMAMHGSEELKKALYELVLERKKTWQLALKPLIKKNL